MFSKFMLEMRRYVFQQDRVAENDSATERVRKKSKVKKKGEFADI